MVRFILFCFLRPSIFIWTMVQFEYLSHSHAPERWVWSSSALNVERRRYLEFSIPQYSLFVHECCCANSPSITETFEWQIKRFKSLIIEYMHTTLMTLKRYKPNANFVAAKWKKKKEKKKSSHSEMAHLITNGKHCTTTMFPQWFCDWRSFCSGLMFLASSKNSASTIVTRWSWGFCENIRGKWKQWSKVIDLSCMRETYIPSKNVATYRAEWSERGER